MGGCGRRAEVVAPQDAVFDGGGAPRRRVFAVNSREVSAGVADDGAVLKARVPGDIDRALLASGASVVVVVVDERVAADGVSGEVNGQPRSVRVG